MQLGTQPEVGAKPTTPKYRCNTQQRCEQVDRLGLGVARRGRGELRGLDRLTTARRELLGPELAHGRLGSFCSVSRLRRVTVALT